MHHKNDAITQPLNIRGTDQKMNLPIVAFVVGSLVTFSSKFGQTVKQSIYLDV